MILITECPKCHKENPINMYLHDIEILIHEDIMDYVNSYKASAVGNGICPSCGANIREVYNTVLTRSDIAELATRKERKP